MQLPDRVLGVPADTPPGTTSAESALQAELSALMANLGQVLAEHSRSSSAHLSQGDYLTVAKLLSCGPIRARSLCELSGLDQSTMSRRLAGLEAAGLVERTPDPADRRAFTVSVTARGRELVEADRADRARLLMQAVGTWESHDIHELTRLLTRLNQAFLTRNH